MSSDKKDIFWRAYVIFFGFVIVMLVALIKTVSIQFEGGKPYFMSSSDGSDRDEVRAQQFSSACAQFHLKRT